MQGGDARSRLLVAPRGRALICAGQRWGAHRSRARPERASLRVVAVRGDAGVLGVLGQKHP